MKEPRLFLCRRRPEGKDLNFKRIVLASRQEGFERFFVAQGRGYDELVDMVVFKEVAYC